MSVNLLALEGVAARLWRKAGETGKKTHCLANRLRRGAYFAHKDDVILTDLVKDLRDLATDLEDVAGELQWEFAETKPRYDGCAYGDIDVDVTVRDLDGNVVAGTDQNVAYF